MIDSFEREAINFRNQHGILSKKADKTRAKAQNRLANPRKINKIAANVVSLVGASMDTISVIQAGPLLILKNVLAEAAYDENIATAGRHKDQYLNEYIAMAKADPLNKPKTISERLESGELRFMTNMPCDPMASQSRERQQYIDDLRVQFGDNGVVTGDAMVGDQALGRPDMFGVYVDAAKWQEFQQKV